MVTSLLHQVPHFDFTLAIASSKLTVNKSKKTFHQDIDLPPQKPPLGGCSAFSHFLGFPQHIIVVTQNRQSCQNE